MTARHDPGDPGDLALAGDPAVSRVIYALRDLGVRGRATAVDVLNAAGAAGLSPAQTEAVLDGIRLTWSDHPLHDEGDEDPPGVSWVEPAPGNGTGGPAYVPPGQR